MAMIRHDFYQIKHPQLLILLDKSLDIIGTAVPKTKESVQKIMRLAPQADIDTLRETVIDSFRLVMDWQKFQPAEAQRANFATHFKAKPIPDSYKNVISRKLDDMLTRLNSANRNTHKASAAPV